MDVKVNDNDSHKILLILQVFNLYFTINRHLPLDHSVGLNDVTSKYTVINMVGPKATELLSELSNSDIHLPAFTYKVYHRTISIRIISKVAFLTLVHIIKFCIILYRL